MVGNLAGRAFDMLLTEALTSTLGLDFAVTTFFWTGAGVLVFATGLAVVAVTLPDLTAFLMAVFTNGLDFSLEWITALAAGLAADFVPLADGLDLTCALVLTVAAGLADFLELPLGLTFTRLALACFGFTLDLCTVLVFLAVVFIYCLLAEIATLGSKLPPSLRFFQLDTDFEKSRRNEAGAGLYRLTQIKSPVFRVDSTNILMTGLFTPNIAQDLAKECLLANLCR